MNDDNAYPVIIDLATWVGAAPPVVDRLDASRLELRDAGLSEAHALLCRAANLICEVLAAHRSDVHAPSVAGELNLIADQLDQLREHFEGSQDNPGLLRRAAVLCAGHEWARLGGLLPSLRVRLAFAAEAIAETAVGLARLRRSGSNMAQGTELMGLEAQEQLVDEGLRRRTAQTGAHSAYAAADSAFLPSLSDFLR